MAPFGKQQEILRPCSIERLIFLSSLVGRTGLARTSKNASNRKQTRIAACPVSLMDIFERPYEM
jgi:hypothetical protein